MIHDIKIFNPKGELIKVVNGQKLMDKHFAVLAESIGKTIWGMAAKKFKLNVICPICKREVEGRANQLTCGSPRCLRERVKVRLRYVTSRKDKKTPPYIHKIVCKECGKREMKQSEKAKYCSKKCANKYTGRINRQKSREMRISIKEVKYG
jgi:hypothetical protein